MTRRSSPHRAVPFQKISALLTSLFFTWGATAAISPERESARIARSLKGVSDSEWSSIAGEKITERYEIMKGDTLYGISGRLFGDSKYWPKVWELNNPNVLNPHFIYPKKVLTFQSGSGSSLPGLYAGDVASRVGDTEYELGSSAGRNLLAEAPGPRWDEKTPKPRGEWKKLPRQPWEAIDIQLPPNIDADGFDSRSYVVRRRATGDELPFLMACQQVEPVGYVKGSRVISRMVSIGHEVTIQPNIAELEKDGIYATLAAPYQFKNGDREALAYPISGQVRIIGANEGTYIAEITQAMTDIRRGDLVVAKPKKVSLGEPINAPSGLTGAITLNPTDTTHYAAQHKWVFIDRGTQDGVGPGMIFRMFQNLDPLTDKKLTNAETLVEGDGQIFASCSNYSLAKVLWSREGLANGTQAIFLSDVSEYDSRYYLNGKVMPSDLEAPAPEPSPSEVPMTDESAPTMESVEDLPTDDLPSPEGSPEDLPATEPSPAPSGDWLDDLDNGQDLNSDEERELQQLEKYEEPAPTVEPLPPVETDALPEPTPGEFPETGPTNLPEPMPAPEPAPLPAEESADDVMPL